MSDLIDAINQALAADPTGDHHATAVEAACALGWELESCTNAGRYVFTRDGVRSKVTITGAVAKRTPSGTRGLGMVRGRRG